MEGPGSVHAIILVAGRGTRMGPLTVGVPKPLLPVAGAPLLGWTLEHCKSAGIREITLVVHEHEAVLRRFVKTSAPKGMKIGFVRQGQPRGTGHALAAAKRAAKNDFVLVYGDVLPTVEDLHALSASKQTAITGAKVADVSPFGELRTRGGRLAGIKEKSGRPRPGLINAGLYRFSRGIFDDLARVKKSSRGEYELTDAVTALASREPVKVIRLKSWAEAGRPWHLLGLQETLMAHMKAKNEGTVEAGVVMHGPVQIGKGTVIKSGTYIEGPVTIGRDCKIGPRTYLRPSTSIGDGCHIGASVEIKNSIIMDRSNVPHLSYIGDSIIGMDCNLGAGTTTANLKVTPANVRATWKDGEKIDTGRRKFGAVVGHGTKIGINCSLAPGTIVGANALIGMAKAVSGWVPDGARVF